MKIIQIEGGPENTQSTHTLLPNKTNRSANWGGNLRGGKEEQKGEVRTKTKEE